MIQIERAGDKFLVTFYNNADGSPDKPVLYSDLSKINPLITKSFLDMPKDCDRVHVTLNDDGSVLIVTGSIQPGGKTETLTEKTISADELSQDKKNSIETLKTDLNSKK